MSEVRMREAEFVGRQQRAARAAQERGLAGLLVWSRGTTMVEWYGDVYYLTNFYSPFPHLADSPHWTGRGHCALILPVGEHPVLVVDIPDYPRDIVYVSDVRVTNHVPQTVAQVLREKGLDREPLGLAGRETLLLSSHQLIETALGRPLRFQPADEIVERLRWIKSESEIELLRRAASVGVDWMEAALNAVEVGKTEGDIVGSGLKVLASRGGLAYDMGVAAGPHSSQHWGRIGIPDWDAKRQLVQGDLVHIDVCGPVDGYFTDFCRSSVVGRRPTSEQREVLDGSVELIKTVVAAIRPGVTADSLYERGQSWLRDNGFIEKPPAAQGPPTIPDFPAIGHGLGIEVESPWIALGNQLRLEPNMVLTIEMMVSKPGIGSAGFEHEVLVTADGHEILDRDCSDKWWE